MKVSVALVLPDRQGEGRRALFLHTRGAWSFQGEMVVRPHFTGGSRGGTCQRHLRGVSFTSASSQAVPGGAAGRQVCPTGRPAGGLAWEHSRMRAYRGPFYFSFL